MKLDREQIDKLVGLAGEHGISLILLFGSAVTGMEHPGSDLDIAILFEKGGDLSYKEYTDLIQSLHEIFPGQEVDLGIINHADPLFLKKITENCQILYGSHQRLQELKIYAFKRYQDHRRFFDMECQYVKCFLKNKAAT